MNSEIVREALEDAGMIQVIQEGRKNDFVPEAEIMALLDGKDGRPWRFGLKRPLRKICKKSGNPNNWILRSHRSMIRG